MTFEQREESRQRGKPVTIYLFRYGPALAAVHGYTDAVRPITWNTVTFKPTPVTMGAVNASGTLDKKVLQVQLPLDSEISQLFHAFPPSYVVTLVILQGHLDDPAEEFLAIWAGRVLGRKISGDMADLACEPISTSLRRAGLRRHYQYMCPHVLYGPGCKASRSAATVSAVPVGLESEEEETNLLVLDAGWAPDALISKFIGGVVEWTIPEGKEVRTILNVEVGNPLGDYVLHLTGPIDSITPGQSVQISLGCNHQMDDCETIHNNILNFGGHPWIPTSNPIGTFSNEYY